MHTLFIEDVMRYDGTQLVSHWAFREYGLQGDSAVAFVGPCDVRGAALVDLADAREGAVIAADSMLHFIVEHFDGDLDRMVLRQRLFISLAADLVNERAGRVAVRRAGDDLYDGEAKLSVSIATVSAVSCLMHTGLNVTTAGTPVKTRGLQDFGLDVRDVAVNLMRRYADEMASARLARCKVRPVP